MVHIGFTAPANMSGQPSISVNAGFTDDGRTVGLAVTGRRFDDIGVLRAAAWWEAARPATREPGLADPAAVGCGSAQADRRCGVRLGSGRMTSGVTSHTPSRARPDS